MSFRCGNCNRVDQVPHRVVLEYRTHDHPIRDQYGNQIDSRRGPQIAKEANLCGKCYIEYHPPEM